MSDRIKFASKKMLALWCAAQGIALLRPITQKQGNFTIVPVLPPSDNQCMYGQTFRMGQRGEPTMVRATRFTYTPRIYVSGAGSRDMTPAECAVEDVRIARLNEIDALVEGTEGVYLHTH